jgi:hypothetical protein
MNIPGMISPIQLDFSPVYRCTLTANDREFGFKCGACPDDVFAGFTRVGGCRGLLRLVSTWRAILQRSRKGTREDEDKMQDMIDYTITTSETEYD